MRKSVFWVSSQVLPNWAVQSQLKFQIYKVEGLYYTCSKNKGIDQLRCYCAFVFSNAKIMFSHDAAHIG